MKFHKLTRIHQKELENSENLYIYIYIYCGAEEFGNLGPVHIKPKAHAKEEEMSEVERRRSKLPGDVVEDNPGLGKLRSRKEKAAHHQGRSPKASQGKAQVQ